MEKIKEENDFLKQMNNHCFTAIVVLSGGLAGIIINGFTFKTTILFIFGLYLLCVCILSYRRLSLEIRDNLKRIDYE